MLAILVPDPSRDYKETAKAVMDDVLWKLGKRPVAFRVLGDCHEWRYYENEREAVLAAERHDTEYQGLYIRDGN